MAYGNPGNYLMEQANYGAAGQMLMGPAGGMYGKKQEKLYMPGLPPAQKISLPGLLATIIVPWITFVVVIYVRGMGLRYSYPWLSLGVAFYFLICVFVAGVMTVSACRDAKQGNPVLLGLAFGLLVIAWVSAWFAGDAVFKFTEAYYDVQNLNAYPSVDPSKFRGTQLMDAGIIEFTKKSTLDLSKSVGFKDGDIYCVAPIVVDDMKHYDFWAVGINCCAPHTLDQNGVSSFRCGEYNIPTVHNGLRLMDDDQRGFFRLAVKEAEAAYNIEASQPVFLHWLGDPAGETSSYQDDAFKYFVLGVSVCGGVVAFIVLAFGIIMSMSA